LDLKGNLSVFEPIAVFQLFNLASSTGELTIETEENSARIYFERGDVTYADINKRPVKLGERLVSEGHVTQDRLDEALAQKDDNRKLGVRLIEDGVVDESTLRRVLKDRVKEVIYEVVRWTDGTFSFIDGRRSLDQDIAIDIPLDHLMLEGLQRLDEEGEPE